MGTPCENLCYADCFQALTDISQQQNSYNWSFREHEIKFLKKKKKYSPEYVMAPACLILHV